ncbi:dephospho-CoA kinase [Streptococcus ilei]|jgi:dephospho-coA kinase|uniref:dephospho-CoA kinase n=1 Tax=Streptococcus TaxID=1301 RepID=UPI0003B93670|nr:MULTISPECIES: dephospho-CoA kinase [Streptococcus]AGY38597.1 dephospho-CoA kinase [Streptococcus ilei]AGY40078.1 dephospho-CoA kinase [Streptococcus ilei]QXW96321.1 dephospho-CoA kinase [Streptococcus rubneri]RJU51222.1 dephospho-CoA kinase [Streptococcus sp. AM28-20]
MGKIIGLTGGIASGKSTVTSYLREKGYAVIDADRVVHDLQAQGGELYQALVEHFGTEILLDTGDLNRPALAERIFSSQNEIAWSNQVQGEMIRKALARERDRLAETEDLFFMDIPLLIEQGYLDWFDQVWLVYVTEDTQLERLMERNALTEDQVRDRLAAQMSLEEKKALVDLVIDNNSKRDHLYQQIDRVLEQIERR